MDTRTIDTSAHDKRDARRQYHRARQFKRSAASLWIAFCTRNGPRQAPGAKVPA